MQLPLCRESNNLRNLLIPLLIPPPLPLPNRALPQHLQLAAALRTQERPQNDSQLPITLKPPSIHPFLNQLSKALISTKRRHRQPGPKHVHHLHRQIHARAAHMQTNTQVCAGQQLRVVLKGQEGRDDAHIRQLSALCKLRNLLHIKLLLGALAGNNRQHRRLLRHGIRRVRNQRVEQDTKVLVRRPGRAADE